MLLSEANVTNDRWAVIKFQRGLHPSIQNTIAEQPNRPVGIRGWYAAAQELSQARATNVALMGTSSWGTRVSQPAAGRYT